MWNGFFRTIILGYLGYVTIAFEGFKKAQKTYFPFLGQTIFDEDKTTFIAVVQAILTLVFCIWFRNLTYNIIFNNKEKLETNKWSTKFSSLTMGLDL